MLKKNIEREKRKNRETFVGLGSRVQDHKKNYTRKEKHKKTYVGEE